MNVRSKHFEHEAEIKLLGIGSSKDKELKANIIEALHELQIQARIEEINEIEQLLKYNINSIPAVILNGEILFENTVPSVSVLKASLKKLYSKQEKKYEIQKILVPTDFSPNAQNALEYAIQIANYFGINITLLHTYKMYSSAGMLVSVESFMERDSEEMMAEEKSKFQNKLENGARLKTKVVKGEVISSIKNIAHKESFDFVVMGTQGASGLKEVFLGSVTNALIKRSKTAILAIPTNYKFQDIKNIVLAVDEQALSNQEVLLPLKKIATGFDAEIKVFHHVMNGEIDIDPKISNALGDVNHSFHYDLNNKGLNESIHHFVEESNADMLCMIRRKRGFWQNLLHNSATSEEAFHSKIPLLILQEE